MYTNVRRSNKEENVVLNTIQLEEEEGHSVEVITAPAMLNLIHAMLSIDTKMQNFDNVSYTQIVAIEQNNVQSTYLHERQESLASRDKVKNPNEIIESATKKLQLGGEWMPHIVYGI